MLMPDTVYLVCHPGEEAMSHSLVYNTHLAGFIGGVSFEL